LQRASVKFVNPNVAVLIVQAERDALAIGRHGDAVDGLA
jgi:hypothetical protein